MFEKKVKTRVKCVLFFKFIGLTGLSIFLIAGIFTQATFAEDNKSADKCTECHEDVVKAFKGNLHFKVETGCIDCHGSAAKHLENPEPGTIIAFKTESAAQKSAQCMQCHQNHVSNYLAGPHAKASMDCTTCHGGHRGSHSKKILRTKLCMGCHQDVSAEFKLNEKHKLQEGVLDCVSCHEPHGSFIRSSLVGFKNETCAKCHKDKDGPFIFEHEAGVIEGCSTCHTPHGSPNRHLLNTQNVAQLCFSCHTAAPSWHSRFTTMASNCVSCHSTIHGSNMDKLFMK